MENRLENELFGKVKSLDDLGKEFSLEDSLLIVSGVDSTKELGRYKKKIEKLHSLYKNYNDGETNLEKAENLFNFIWKGKKDIYLEEKNDDDFSVRRLNRIIDRFFLRKDNSVGNCVGLTNLGAVLGLRENINFDCSPEEGCMSLNYKFYLRYYQDKKKVVCIKLGQAAILTDAADNIYDSKVVDSFKLL